MSKNNKKKLQTALDKLTPKQLTWTHEYAAHGNGRRASSEAGYSGSASVMSTIGQKNAQNPKILKVLELMQLNDDRIATRKERQAFWTKVMHDENESMRDRLRASKLLGKASADFVKRVEHSGKIDSKVEYDLSFSKEDEENNE